jgi:hypothetical protein
MMKNQEMLSQKKKSEKWMIRKYVVFEFINMRPMINDWHWTDLIRMMNKLQNIKLVGLILNLD